MNIKIKKVISLAIIGLCVTQLIGNSVVVAKGASNYGLLGTNNALGSPILNTDFTAESWDKNEMLTWGVFLSNFPTPLIDDYATTFNSNSSEGSKGSGLKALQFGSGSDAQNNETLKALLDSAVTQQRTAGLKDIYVSYSEVDRTGITQVEPESGKVRKATFKDIFLSPTEEADTSWVALSGMGTFSSPLTVPIDGDSVSNSALANLTASKDMYPNMVTLEDGALPTFSVEYSGGYEKIFDYTDAWDAQLITALLARVLCGDFKDTFADTFNDMWTNSAQLPLKLDCFGNIVVEYNGSRRIVLPASSNQHLTSTPKINLLNSLVFNGLQGSLSSDDMIAQGQQFVTGWFGSVWTDARFSGVPALGSEYATVPEGTISLYYDLDTIAYNNYFKGGPAANGQKTVSGESIQPYSLHYGKAVKELFDLDANKESGNNYVLKLEANNMNSYVNSLTNRTVFTDDETQVVQTMLSASGQIANLKGASTNTKMLTSIITKDGEMSLFGEPVIVPVQMDVGTTDGYINSVGASRRYINFLYNTYKIGSNSEAGEITQSYMATLLESDKTNTMTEFKKTFLGLYGQAIPKTLASFIDKSRGLFDIHVSPSKLPTAIGNNASNPFKSLGDIEIDGEKIVTPAYSTKKEPNDLEHFGGRLLKLYPQSDTMNRANALLGIRDGTEFSVYSTYIYLTYLDWYGTRIDKITGKSKSDFNTHIFDGKSDIENIDITSIASVKSEADKKEEVLNYTYMMLHPEEGKAYRQKILSDYQNNFFYTNYQKMAYGSASSYNSGAYSNVSTRSNTGFLTLQTYEDNFLTSAFMKYYAQLAVYLIAIASILLVVIGLLKGKRLSWFLVSFAVVINIILIVPSVGDLLPKTSNKMVQNLFQNKMSYWNISESVKNAKLEAEYADGTSDSTSYLSGLSKETKAQVLSLVKSLSTVYLDRELMVKMDISKKVTQTSDTNFDQVQSLRSARWLLPTLMRQYTTSNSGNDYVYVPIGDIYDDLSNLYWMYNPADASYTNTLTSQQTTTGTTSSSDTQTISAATVEDPITVSLRKTYFPDYTDTTIKYSGSKANYRSEAYTNRSSTDEMPHTYSYILKSTATPLSRDTGFEGEYKGESSYKDYVKHANNSGKAQLFLSETSLLEKQASSYNSSKRSTMKQFFGYLWATESPYHYFYEAIKDTFSSDITLGALIGGIQGQYVDPNGKNNTDEDFNSDEAVRTSFMYAEKTGYTKDVLDLQELFTNMIPYLYQMQITAGGLDGTSGVLGDTKIQDYELYKDNYKSWLFRSNWVTKIMESPQLSDKEVVRDNDNKRITILNPVMPSCYTNDRPMIYSEAQMYAEGLTEAQLTLAELKCIKVNKEVTKQWTMLLNYVNLDGMTKEVLMRQMATDAVTIFDKEFSPSGVLNQSYAMYPDGVELRAISFDSVMRMLMLNITGNTNYASGDTMQNIIENSDTFTSLILLIATFLCAFLVPLMTSVTLGCIFYLAIVSIVYSILSSSKHKLKVSCGYIISNIIFFVLTIAYYKVFSFMMAVTSNDAVLTVQSVQVNTGSPIVCFIVITAASLVYGLCMIKMIKFCFKNYKDMGMQVYSEMASAITSTIQNGVQGLLGKISSFGSEEGGETSSTSSGVTGRREVNQGYKASDSETNSKQGRVEGNTKEDDFMAKQHFNEEEGNTREYSDTTVDDINNEIDKGKEAAQKENKEEKKETKKQTSKKKDSTVM